MTVVDGGWRWEVGVGSESGRQAVAVVVLRVLLLTIRVSEYVTLGSCARDVIHLYITT